MIENISIVIITRDAAETLQQTLESVQQFAEVVVYDNGSTDATLDIASRYPNVKLHCGEFFGFGPTKNHALGLAKNDWVLSLDSDEALSPELVEELSGLNLDSPELAYQVLRDNYFMGKLVRRGGWGDDWLVRLFHRTYHRFDDSLVHEKVVLPKNSQALRLAAPISHSAVNRLSDFLDKINRYSELRMEVSRKTYHPAVILLRSVFAFLKSYVIKRGFLEGWRGLVIAVANANGVFFKYMKIYAKRNP
jgi:glycosyltransferase involved in cell wall biosynthesis